MGRFIASWGFRGSVSSFPLHLPLLSSFFTLSLSFSLQLSPKNSIGTFCQPLYCTAAACSDHCTFLGNCPPTPPPNQYQNLLLRQGKMLAQGRSRWPVSQKRIMIRLFQVLRQWGSRKSKRHAKSWRRGRRCLFFSCSHFSVPDYLGAWNRLLAATSSPPGGGGYQTNIWVQVSQ